MTYRIEVQYDEQRWGELYQREERKPAESRAANLSKQYPNELFRLIDRSRYGYGYDRKETTPLGFWFNGVFSADAPVHALPTYSYATLSTYDMTHERWGAAKSFHSRAKLVYDTRLEKHSYYRIGEGDGAEYMYMGKPIDHQNILARIADNALRAESEAAYLVPEDARSWSRDNFKLDVLKESALDSPSTDRIAAFILKLANDLITVRHAADEQFDDPLSHAIDLLHQAADALIPQAEPTNEGA